MRRNSPGFLGVKWLVLAAAGLVVIVGVLLAVQSKRTSGNGNANRTASANVSTRSSATAVPAPPAGPVDTDGDGLSDADEAKLGTDPKLVDTDGDGLSDREEVNVFKTNPKLKDTDGDGRLDGEEVKAGDNPNGPGQLLDLQKAISNTAN